MAMPASGQEIFAEFVGTYMLVFTIGCNVMCMTPVWAGVSIASVLVVMIYAFGKVSGANFNPAVSFALGLVKSMGGDEIGMGWGKVGIYIAVQLVASLAAGFSYLALFQNSFNLQPAVGFGFLSSGACEAYYTFMLCFVVLNVAVARKSEDWYVDKDAKLCENQYYGLAIGSVIVAGAYGAGSVSGGCFNPAVAFGIDVASAYLGLGWFLIYWVFQFFAAWVAVFFFKLVRPYEFTKEDEDAEYQKPSVSSQCVAEFTGTFMLVMTVGLNVLGKSVAGPFSIAAALMSMIYALGDVSGAHFNPAVTLAFFCLGKIDREPDTNAQNMRLYIIAQVLGGIIAAFGYAFVYHGHSFPLGPGESYNWSQVAIAEIMFTFVLVLVVLTVADAAKETHLGTMFGLAIGSCVTVGGFAIGAISGGSLNPAVSFGIASSQIMNGGMFWKSLVYSSFECIGALAAVAVVGVTHAEKSADDDKQPTP